jgi:hypothetical protein
VPRVDVTCRHTPLRRPSIGSREQRQQKRIILVLQYPVHEQATSRVALVTSRHEVLASVVILLIV